jgi:hypothetical protein
MARKKKKSTSFNAALNLQRNQAIRDGFYDGRFKEKRIKDKKKEEDKFKARRKVRPEKD